ncbi:MAG: ATP-dependent zinc protease [Flavobacteriales bacterium]|nr:ATP-dependent zinc protease [Flavobacteriales bacterium]
MESTKTIIGRWDYADFLDFNIENIPVKTDTGAYTSSLRCSSIEEITSSDGASILRYTILEEDHFIPVEKRTFETTEYSTRIVKNSGGNPKKRFSIRTTIRLFGKDKSVEFTLAERKGLRFPVLLGRKFLGNQYLVDPSKTRLSYTQKKNELNG